MSAKLKWLEVYLEFSRASVDQLPVTWRDKANIGPPYTYFISLTWGDCGVINEWGFIARLFYLNWYSVLLCLCLISSCWCFSLLLHTLSLGYFTLSWFQPPTLWMIVLKFYKCTLGLYLITLGVFTWVSHRCLSGPDKRTNQFLNHPSVRSSFCVNCVIWCRWHTYPCHCY